MKPSSEPLELLTVTQQNGFTAHINRRASLHLAFDKYMGECVTHPASKCIYQWERKTVKKDIISEIFGYLRGRNIVSSESEFSEHWLGYSESYMRKLRQKKAEPSLGAVAICASRLQCAAEQMAPLPRYHHIGEELSAMSKKCRELVDADSVEFDLSAY